MRDLIRTEIRTERFRFRHLGFGILSVVVALLVPSCAVGPDQAGMKSSTGNTEAKASPRTMGIPLSYFIASRQGELPSDGKVLSVFQTLGGETFEVWREREASRTIAFDEIQALRVREGRPELWPAQSPDYVLAEVKLTGGKADSFLSLLESQSDGDLWIENAKGEAIEFLPVVFALRPSDLRSSPGIWVSAGRFRGRKEAEAFFEGLRDVPRSYLALSESERASARARNRQIFDYAIWESVCDPEELAEVGGRLAELLPTLPDYAERAREADCRVRPRLGEEPQSRP